MRRTCEPKRTCDEKLFSLCFSGEQEKDFYFWKSITSQGSESFSETSAPLIRQSLDFDELGARKQNAVEKMNKLRKLPF